MSGRVFLGWLAALVLVALSGIQVAFSTQRVRELHIELQALQGSLDDAVEEYSRLQIELAAVAAYQNVERTAEVELEMRFPDEVRRVEP